MRPALAILALGAWGAFAPADAPHASADGKYSVRFPAAPKVSEQSVKSALGELTVHTATYSDSGGNTFLVSYTDYPADAVMPEKRGKFFDGIRDSVKGDGKLDSEKEIKAGGGGWPGREFTVDKGRQRVKYRVVLRDNRLYQLAAIGTEGFVGGREAKDFFESFELTK